MDITPKNGSARAEKVLWRVFVLLLAVFISFGVLSVRQMESGSIDATALSVFMDDYLYLALLVLAAGFVSCCAGILYIRYRHRACGDPAESQWPGHGIDTSEISDRIRRLRSDYVSALPLGTDATDRRASILKLTRRVIGRLPYFRRRVSLSRNSIGSGWKGPLARSRRQLATESNARTSSANQ